MAGNRSYCSVLLKYDDFCRIFEYLQREWSVITEFNNIKVVEIDK